MADGGADDGGMDGWRRVWHFIEQRRIALGWSKEMLYTKTHTSDGTYRKMRLEGKGIERPEKFVHITQGLGWTVSSIYDILNGGEPTLDFSREQWQETARDILTNPLQERVERLARDVEWLLGHVEELTGERRPPLDDVAVRRVVR